MGREELRDAFHFFVFHRKKIPLLKSSSGRDFGARQRERLRQNLLDVSPPASHCPSRSLLSICKMDIVSSPRAGSEGSPHKHKKLFRPLTSPSPTPTDDIGAVTADEMITLVLARWAQGRQRLLNNSECQKEQSQGTAPAAVSQPDPYRQRERGWVGSLAHSVIYYCAAYISHDSRVYHSYCC